MMPPAEPAAPANQGEWFLTRVTLLGAVVAVLLAALYLGLGSTFDARCAGACAAICTATPFAWRGAHGHPLVSHVALALLAAIFTTAAMCGALAYLAWLGLISIFSFMLMGHRAGYAWMGVVFALVALIFAFNALGSAPVSLSEGTVLVRMLRVASIVPTLALTGFLFERNRQQNEASLERAVSARSRLLAHVSHEMRTPLNGIIGLTQALQLDPALKAANESLGLIQQSGETLLSLINDLLDVARAEAGNAELALHAFDLTRLIERTAALHRARPEAEGVWIKTEGPRSVWVKSDAVRLQQVLTNLLSNATRHGGGAPVTVRLVTRTRDEKLGVEISVIDAGPGLSQAHREQLFRPFVQLDQRTAPGGSGLGLYISRSLAQSLGGDLSVSSTPGFGCTFTVTLLLEPAPPTLEQQPAKAARVSGRVLVVDDNAINRHVAQSLLGKLGLEVETVPGGEEAITWLEHHRVDLVLMDLQMPGLDGFETTRKLRSAGFARPIIALTASAQVETAGECTAAGMNGCLVKPLRLEQAVPVLEKYLPPVRPLQLAARG